MFQKTPRPRLDRGQAVFVDRHGLVVEAAVVGDASTLADPAVVDDLI